MTSSPFSPPDVGNRSADKRWRRDAGNVARVRRAGRRFALAGSALFVLSLGVAISLRAQSVEPAAEAPGAAPSDAREPGAPPAARGDQQSIIQLSDPYEVMRRGGYLMWPILLCSLVTATFGLERLISLRRGRVIPPRFTREFLERVRRGEIGRAAALKLCAENGSPMAAIFQAAVRHWGSPAATIEQAVTEAGQREIVLLRRNLRALQGSANLATLLGLLGTITGMIRAFNDVAVLRAIGRAEVLANGIAEALLTTAGGLAVAIPSIFLYTYFTGRVERLVHAMDDRAIEMVDAISAETIGPGASAHLDGSGPRPGAPAPSGSGGKVVPKYVS